MAKTKIAIFDLTGCEGCEFHLTRKIVSKIKKVAPPDFTEGIEGHGVLKINLKKREAKFVVEESERLVEGLLLGKD